MTMIPARNHPRVRPDGGPTARALILREDPDLAETLSAERRRRVGALLTAELLRFEPGLWEPPPANPASYGLLLLDGLLSRQVRIGRALNTELFGPGDILRPWEGSQYAGEVFAKHSWQVLAHARLALLDPRTTSLICSCPELSLAFSARLIRHAGWLSQLMAISHLNRVEDRLLGLLWHMAGMWGRVTPVGVAVPFRLTHQLLGEIVGAQRPSVTAAMRTLKARKAVAPMTGGGFLLQGRAPGSP